MDSECEKMRPREQKGKVQWLEAKEEGGLRIRIFKCGQFQELESIINIIIMSNTEAAHIRTQELNQSAEKHEAQGSKEYKRTPCKNWETESLNTIRKYNSHSLLNQDSENTAKSSHQHEEEPESHQAPVEELSVIEEQQSVVSSSLPIRERVGHLLPSYMAASYSVEHIKLLQAQTRLDQLLDFLRLQRHKPNGEHLSSIRRMQQQNYETVLELEQLKQILFLKPDFYTCTERKSEQGKSDILIAMSELTELEDRKQQFRKTLFQYLTDNDGFAKNKTVKIPTCTLPFLAKDEPEKKESIVGDIKNKCSLWFQRAGGEQRINPFDALRPGNSKKFQEMLMAKIKENERRLQEEKEKEKQVNFGCKELLAVFDELPKVYKKREKSSMFKSCIIQDIDKCLNIKQETISKILEVLLAKYPDFFKVIDHKSGQILQIQVKAYNETRIKIEKDTPKNPQLSEKENEKEAQPIRKPEPPAEDKPKIEKDKKTQGKGNLKSSKV